MSPYPWAGPKVLEKVTPSRECLRAFPLELSSAHLGLRLAVLNIRPRFTQLCSQGRVRGLLPLPGVGLLLLLHQAVGERPAGAEDPAATQKPCRGLSPAKRWRGVTVGFFFSSKQLKPVYHAWPSQRKPRTCASSPQSKASWSSKRSRRRVVGRARGSPSSSLCPRPPGPEPPPGNAPQTAADGGRHCKCSRFLCRAGV